jgi:hypothetical protein
MASTGLNKPCFCGSGKRYEDCCFLKDMEELGERGFAATGSWLKEAMVIRSFNSLQEAQETLDRVVSDRNNTPLDDFCGLSPAQIHRLLYDPFGDGSLARYNLKLTDFPEAPILKILKQILIGLSQGGLKMTAKGNLPPAFSRAVALSYYGEEGFREKTLFGKLRREQDWGEIHTVRLIAELAGFVKKEKGRFKLTQKGEQVFFRGLNGRSFLDLFRAYTLKFNWAYRDGYPQMSIIQNSFLYTLFCLHRFGDERRSGDFYGELFLRAFPMVLDGLSQSHPYWNPEEEAKRCFSLRALERFASFFGFADVRMPGRHQVGLPLEVKKAPFLDSWISFRIEYQ